MVKYLFPFLPYFAQENSRVMTDILYTFWNLRDYLNVVKAAIPGNESCYFLSVLDKLNTDALSDCRVRLLRLYATEKVAYW